MRSYYERSNEMPKRKQGKSTDNTADLFTRLREPAYLLDQRFYDLTRENKNLLVPWFLMSCYAYYHRDVSILADATFDQICVQLERHWDDIRHYHKHLIITSGSSIKATAFQLRDDQYPQIVKAAMIRLICITHESNNKESTHV